MVKDEIDEVAAHLPRPDKSELSGYVELKQRLEAKLREVPNLSPYRELLGLLERATDVAVADSYSGSRDEAIEELRSFLS